NKWRYHSWDAEHVMEGLSDNSTSRDDDGAPTRLHHVLKQHPEYKRQFADQVYNLFFNDGLLTPVQLRKHYQELLDEIDRAVVGESARWGDNHRDQPYTRNVEWIEERDWLMDVYFEERSDIVLDQIRSQDLFPNVIAPIFLVDGSVQPGGEIIKGASLSMSAPRGTIYYTTNGTDPFVIDHSSTNSQILVPQNATKWAYCPDSDIGNTWRIDIDYDHSGWSKCEGGPGGIGYERDSGYESLITLDTENEMWDANDNAATSCFIRIPFDVSADQLEKIVSLKLNMRYDDGFAAYLNGLKVANENVPTSPRWESVALGNHEAASIESYDITSDQSRLNAGKNILAIHGMNVHAHSSDFIITAELVTSDEATEGTVSPDAKIYSAPLTLNESTEIKARAKNGSTWSPVHRAVFAIAEKMDALKLTEIHYHPLDSNDTNDREFEFVELKNISTTAINLSLSGFQNGIRYTLGGGVILQPGKFIVLASNSEKFKSRYGYAPFDQYEGNLDNAGERIVFTNAAGDTIINVRFNDKDPWPAGADGDGYSLVAVDVNPQKDPNDPTYWGVSYKLHGSPGRDDNTATIVVKSETPPIRYDLRQNYPNPFNPSTTIQFDVPLSSHVKLDIYNVLGQHVVTLTDDQYRPGTFTIRWDAVNCAAGVYFYRIKAGEFLSIKKLILVK
ncbi:T9SS type A sorting domain-containing protein, partial [candidate division KSB1 bacterium]|nr:T9SS type A sorting domain-containing protein [candidate division KSB1 bacterium]